MRILCVSGDATARRFAFGLRQLANIDLKDVFLAINDPATSMQAMDRMEVIFIVLEEKAVPPRVREPDAEGRRTLARVGYYDFEDVVSTPGCRGRLENLGLIGA